MIRWEEHSEQDRRWTPTNPRPPQIHKSQHDQSCPPTITSHFLSHILYVVCTSPPMSRFKKLSKVRCQQPLVCWHGSVAFPILPIHIANLSRLSKCTLPIISIPKPLKLSNSLSWTSYPIWQMSILMFAWRVSDNQVLLRSDAFLNSYGGWHAITLQWCFHSNKMSVISHSYVSAFWLQLHILRCGLDGTPMFWNGQACRKRRCSVLRMRAIPGWSTW